MKEKNQKLLLHACCAPCLTSSEAQTHTKYDVLPFWYNPNIEPIEEHDKRKAEYIKFIGLKEYCDESSYDYLKENKEWHRIIDGLEKEPEGEKRCQRCIEFRLRKTAEFAKCQGVGLFSTTLSISPHKNLKMIYDAGAKNSSTKCDYERFDFKKNDGYKRSIELSKEFDLYRQSYCGCAYSIREKK